MSENKCDLGPMHGMASTYTDAASGKRCCDFCGQPVEPARTNRRRRMTAPLVERLRKIAEGRILPNLDLTQDLARQAAARLSEQAAEIELLRAAVRQARAAVGDAMIVCMHVDPERAAIAKKHLQDWIAKTAALASEPSQ